MTQKNTKKPVAVQIDGIGKLAEVLLKAGKNVDETLAGIHRVFKGAKTTKKSIYFYASNLGIKLRQGATADSKQLKKLMAELKRAA